MIAVVVFSLLARSLGACSMIHSPHVFFIHLNGDQLVHPSSTFFFYILGQDQSILTQQDETTVAECSLKSCMLARFLIGSHAVPAQ